MPKLKCDILSDFQTMWARQRPDQAFTYLSTGCPNKFWMETFVKNLLSQNWNLENSSNGSQNVNKLSQFFFCLFVILRDFERGYKLFLIMLPTHHGKVWEKCNFGSDEENCLLTLNIDTGTILSGNFQLSKKNVIFHYRLTRMFKPDRVQLILGNTSVLDPYVEWSVGQIQRIHTTRLQGMYDFWISFLKHFQRNIICLLSF